MNARVDFEKREVSQGLGTERSDVDRGVKLRAEQTIVSNPDVAVSKFTGFERRSKVSRDVTVSKGLRSSAMSWKNGCVFLGKPDSDQT